MRRIIIHWTGGNWTPCAQDREHYHYLVDVRGKVHEGKYKPEDNLDCTDGRYAAHTGGLNTGSIGVAMCGMKDYKNPKNQGPCPISKVQAEACFKLSAELLKKYGLKPSQETVLTHYEVGKKFPNSTSAGKIDVNFLPYVANIGQDKVGDYIRNKVRWYYGR